MYRLHLCAFWKQKVVWNDTVLPERKRRELWVWSNKRFLRQWENCAWSSLTYIFGSLLFFLLLTRGLFFVWFSKRKIKTHLQIQASFITPFIFFLLSPCPLGPSLPGKRTCTSAEFVQRQTAHYLQEWNIKERRSGTCSPNTPLSSPEKPGVYHENCGGMACIQ